MTFGIREAIGMVLVPLMIPLIGGGYLFLAFAHDKAVKRWEQKEYQQGNSSRCPSEFGDWYLHIRKVEEIAERKERGEVDEAIAKIPLEERNAIIERALIDVRAMIKRWEDESDET